MLRIWRRFGTVTKSRVKQLTPKDVLIDVRNPDETMLGVIPQAKCLPLPELSQAFSLDPKQFLKKYKFEKPDKAASLIFYCQAGVRSAKACVLAEEHGFQNVNNYAGSWGDWVSHN